MASAGILRAAHTAGKWGQKEFEDGWSVDTPRHVRSLSWQTIGSSARRYPIAIVLQQDKHIWRDGDRELDANVALLSAAPKMLAALRAAEACLSIVEPRSDRAEYLKTLKAVRAAIAAAEAEAGRWLSLPSPAPLLKPPAAPSPRSSPRLPRKSPITAITSPAKTSGVAAARTETARIQPGPPFKLSASLLPRWKPSRDLLIP